MASSCDRFLGFRLTQRPLPLWPERILPSGASYPAFHFSLIAQRNFLKSQTIPTVCAEMRLLSYSTGAILALHWGTFHRTIRTKDAAIAGFGAEQRLTASAFVEELTGVSWHRFAFGEAANRTYQHGFQNKLAHTRLSLPGRPYISFLAKGETTSLPPESRPLPPWRLGI